MKNLNVARMNNEEIEKIISKTMNVKITADVVMDDHFHQPYIQIVISDGINDIGTMSFPIDFFQFRNMFNVFGVHSLSEMKGLVCKIHLDEEGNFIALQHIIDKNRGYWKRNPVW